MTVEDYAITIQQSPLRHAAADKMHTKAGTALPSSTFAGVQNKLHEYQILGELGKGCFSTVYHAVHKPTHRDVALKVIKSTGNNLDAIVTEITALRRLAGHPHIIELYDVFAVDDYIYLSLEYCSNGNLHDFLVNRGRLNEEQAQFWFRQLVSGVLFCQSQGVVSRDIKNSNIVIDSHFNLKITDFGLAVLVGNVNTDRIRQSAGSAVFAAPEVYGARQTPYHAVPSEMWALGAVLHSMVRRVLPFPHVDYAKHWHAYIAPVDASPALQHLLISLLTFDPAKRASPTDVLAHVWFTSPVTPAPAGSAASSEPARLAARRHSRASFSNGYASTAVAGG